MSYVGVDLHQKTTWFYVVDSYGNKLDSRNVPNTEEDLKNYFEKIPKPFTLAVESTYNWYFFVDLAEQYAEEVFLANSYELKAFAKRHKKTDKIDAPEM
ncbi:MAG: IS110 family transposase [Thermodesulfobacteriota bacterium]